MLNKIVEDKDIFDQMPTDLLKDKRIVSTFNPPLRFCSTQEAQLRRKTELSKKLKFSYQLKNFKNKSKTFGVFDKCISWVDKNYEKMYNDPYLRVNFSDLKPDMAYKLI